MAGGLESDDANLSEHQLAFMIGYYRARLIKQDQDKGRLIKELYTQNLGRVTIIEADKNECCVSDGCVLRTELQIPRPLETHLGLNLTFVGNTDGRPYNKYTHNSLYWKRAAKYTGGEPSWYFQNGYLYIVDPPSIMLDEVNIQGIFEDPYVAQKFRTCDCPKNVGDCTGTFPSLDFNYPMPLHHVDTIVKLVAETELRILSAFPNDISNDSLDQIANVLNNARGKKGI